MLSTIKNLKFTNIWQNFFYLGIFLLPTASFFGTLILLSCLIQKIIINKKSFFKDSWNIPIYLMIFFILSSTLTNYLFLPKLLNNVLEPGLMWLGLINWIPFLISFRGFQYYLNSFEKRINFSKYLLSGTIPILITGISQYWFKIYGPFSTLKGMLIWYQREIGPGDGLTSIFSNQNYAGMWLALVWPFCLGLLIRSKNIFKFFLNLSILTTFSLILILTNSRNAIIGYFTAITFVLGYKSIIIIAVLIMISLILGNLIFPLLFKDFMDYFKKLIPKNFINKFNKFGINNLTEYPRIEIWSKTLKLILDRPIFGWGAASFPILYLIKEGINNAQHTHNLFFELSINFGIITALIFLGFISAILITSYKSIFLEKNNNKILNRAWFTSAFIFFVTSLNDITYFDLRISITFWIILSGLRCIIFENSILKKNLP